MIQVSSLGDRLVVEVQQDRLEPRHENQLAYWGFILDSAKQRFLSPEGTGRDLLTKVVQYLKSTGYKVGVAPETEALLHEQQAAANQLNESRERGSQFKRGIVDEQLAAQLQSFLGDSVPRRLKDHQQKAALHLLEVRNGANFSVPGSGKTSVVLTVYHYLRHTDEVDSLFVVGPPACFGPWKDEYEQTLGTRPTYQIMAGGDIDGRQAKYLVDRDSVSDLYLTTFQTLQRDWHQVRVLFERQDLRFFLVIDEAHYIKQPNGAWATAALRIARGAARRCVLTGTPFPRSYQDAFNLFDALWPDAPPIPSRAKQRIQYHVQQSDFDQASSLLDDQIAPLFYRVRKRDLGLAPQELLAPIRIPMNTHERRAYDAILDRIEQVSRDDYSRDLDLIIRLRRGRMIRLRQCLSYAKLLGSAVSDYQEDLIEGDLSLADLIRHYDSLEMPAKLEALVSLVKNLHDDGEKVLIWSNFVETLKLINATMNDLGFQSRLIYGGTPTQVASVSEELTREAIIREFVDERGISVLVANPAACSESISLHKTCSNAVYYDLSYNCAQYLQSLDRIHRVGGSEDKTSEYHFLQYENTIDGDILVNLQQKAARMSAIIDQDYPIYSMDMFADDDELEAYDRLFKQPKQRI